MSRAAACLRSAAQDMQYVARVMNHVPVLGSSHPAQGRSYSGTVHFGSALLSRSGSMPRTIITNQSSRVTCQGFHGNGE